MISVLGVWVLSGAAAGETTCASGSSEGGLLLRLFQALKKCLIHKAVADVEQVSLELAQFHAVLVLTVRLLDFRFAMSRFSAAAWAAATVASLETVPITRFYIRRRSSSEAPSTAPRRPAISD